MAACSVHGTVPIMVVYIIILCCCWHHKVLETQNLAPLPYSRANAQVTIQNYFQGSGMAHQHNLKLLLFSDKHIYML